MNFIDYCRSFDKEINNVCNSTCKIYKNPRIEFEDLKSEAILKLLELWNKGVDESILLSGKGLVTTVKNHLIDYVRKFYRDPLAKAGSFDEYRFNEFNDSAT